MPTKKEAAKRIQRAVRRHLGKKLRSGRMRRGRYPYPRMSKPLARQSHTFTERVIEEQVLEVNSSGLFMTFALQDIYNSVSYQKLFEYYQLNKVVVHVRYKADGNPRTDVNAATYMPVNEANPVLWFKVDHNDASSDTLDVMKASTRTKEVQLTNNKPNFSIVLRPSILQEAYKSSVASTYIPKWKQWLTMGDPTVPHYGLKMYATGPGAHQNGSCVVTRQYYFTCKNNE